MERVECKQCGTQNSLQAKYCSGCGYRLPEPAIKEIAVSEPNNRKSKKGLGKKIVTAIGTVVAFLAGYFGVQQLFFSSSYEDMLAKVAEEINVSCPLMVDQETRLDNSMALPNNIFQYNYTMVNLEKSEIDTLAFADNMEPYLTNNLRTSPDMKVFRDHKTTLGYNYKDKNGVFILKLLIKPQD